MRTWSERALVCDSVSTSTSRTRVLFVFGSISSSKGTGTIAPPWRVIITPEAPPSSVRTAPAPRSRV